MRKNCSARLIAIGLILAVPGFAHAESLTTLFAQNNAGQFGGAVYLDIEVGLAPIEITGFETNTQVLGTFGWTVYLTEPGDTAEGNESNAAFFPNVAATGTGTGAGSDTPSNVVLNDTFVLDANTTYGMALVMGPEADHRYTNGDGNDAYGSAANEVYSNGDLALQLGAASNIPFDVVTFPSRIWNGTINYEVLPIVIDSSPGLGIPDDGYIGVNDGNDGFGVDAGMACDTIDASGTVAPLSRVSSVAIDLGIEHTWLGDLTVKLQSPDGTILALMERVQGVGSNPLGDNGSNPLGESSNLDGTVLGFADGNAADAETMGSTIDGGQNVCTDDGICAFKPNPDQAQVVGSSVGAFASFSGENADGPWTLCVGDSAGGDVGLFQTWSLRLDTVCASYIGLAGGTLGGPMKFQATARIDLGPDLNIVGDEVEVRAPVVRILDGTQIGGTFTAGNNPVCPNLSVADFEGGVPSGFFTYGDFPTVSLDLSTPLIPDTDPLALPGQVGDNGVFKGVVDVPTFGGFGAGLSPNPDWSGYDGISFWFYGENSGTTHDFEIQPFSGENRRATFVDDFTGWQLISLPFDTFGGGGAYDVSQVKYWVFVLDGTVGTFYMDDLSVYRMP